MKKFFRGFDLVIDVLMILCSVGFVTLAFAQVVCRFVLNSSLTWSEELCRYLFVEMVFLGAGVCVLEKKHASVDIIVNLLPAGARKYYQSVLDFLVVVTGTLIMYFGFRFACGAVGQTCPYAWIPYQKSICNCSICNFRIDGLRNVYHADGTGSAYHSYINLFLNEDGEV